MLKKPLVPATSNPGNVSCDFGGVARNVAENLARLTRRVALVSLVGTDEAGRGLVRHLDTLAVDTSLIQRSPKPTASYTAILEPSGELVLGLADMDLYEEITPSLLGPLLPRLREFDGWFVDANLPAETLEWLVAQRTRQWIAADAVSVPKAARLKGVLREVSPLFLNRAQAAVVADAGESVSGVMTTGPGGLVAWLEDDMRTLPALPAKVRDVTGAGDALIAGTLFGLSEHYGFFEAVRVGLAAAAITVESEYTVSPLLNADSLYARLAADRT